MADDYISSRLTFAHGDAIYSELLELKGNPNAIRRRLRDLIVIGKMHEMSLRMTGPALISPPHSANNTQAAIEAAEQSSPAQPEKFKIPKLNLRGLTEKS